MRGGWFALFLVGCTPSRTVPTTVVKTRPPVVYQVFSRTFADSNGDGWGDLAGIEQRLDHIQHAVGADAVWLTPIHPSPSDHGYDVTDYLGIHPHLGTQADFDHLVRALHARGMQLVMDVVLNHTSSQHPWFTDPAQHDRYVWNTQNPGWRAPWPGAGPAWHTHRTGWYYGLFYSGMPDLNWRNPQVERDMLAVMEHWLNRGVDAFRVDAARYLVESASGDLADVPETHAVLRRLRSAMEKSHPSLWWVGEAWAPRALARTYAAEFHRVFDFDLMGAVAASLNGEKPQPLQEELAAAQTDWAFAATMVGNHDVARLVDRLMGQAHAVESAFTILLTLPGRPFIYAGDEVGVSQAAVAGDAGQRQPLPPRTQWNTALLNHVHQLLAQRRQHAALGEQGAMELLPPWQGVAWLRGADAQRVLVAVNPHDHPLEGVVLPAACASAPSLWPRGPDAMPGPTGLLLPAMAAHATRVWACANP